MHESLGIFGMIFRLRKKAVYFSRMMYAAYLLFVALSLSLFLSLLSLSIWRITLGLKIDIKAKNIYMHE